MCGRYYIDIDEAELRGIVKAVATKASSTQTPVETRTLAPSHGLRLTPTASRTAPHRPYLSPFFDCFRGRVLNLSHRRFTFPAFSLLNQ